MSRSQSFSCDGSCQVCWTIMLNQVCEEVLMMAVCVSQQQQPQNDEQEKRESLCQRYYIIDYISIFTKRREERQRMLKTTNAREEFSMKWMDDQEKKKAWSSLHWLSPWIFYSTSCCSCSRNFDGRTRESSCLTANRIDSYSWTDNSFFFFQRNLSQSREQHSKRESVKKNKLTELLLSCHDE